MRARVTNTTDSTVDNIKVPQRILDDEEYAREFRERLISMVPNGDYGESFEEWYEYVKQIAFYQKMSDIYDDVKKGDK